MMSSAIPARLQFQCGHAAIVSLPRVKGESAAQRNDRIAQEKSAALSRECDFCAPAVVTAVNGNGHVVADLPEPEPMLAIVSDVAQPEPEPEVLVVLAEAEAPLAEQRPVAEEESETVVRAAETSPLQELVAEELTPVDEVVQELVLVGMEATETQAADLANGEAATPARGVRRRAARKVRAEELARGRRFLVEYRVERVLQAVDIHDALRQASTLGAAQVTAITRED